MTKKQHELRIVESVSGVKLKLDSCLRRNDKEIKVMRSKWILILMLGMSLAVCFNVNAKGKKGARQSKQAAASKEKVLVSPDQEVVLNFEIKAGDPVYRVWWKGKKIINDSALGVEIAGQSFEGGFEIVNVTESKSDTTWKPVCGQFSEIRDNYNQMAIELQEKGSLKRKMGIVFRAYDDGAAFRYVFEKQPGLENFVIESEQTEFCFANDHTVWYPDHGSFLLSGPVKLSDVGKNIETNQIVKELNNKNKNGHKIADDNLALTPMTIQAGDDLFICIHEAALDKYASMNLKLVAGKDFALKSDLASKVKCSAPMKSPWRVIMLADRCGGLLESSIIANLNEPCAIKDTSWIKPGKSMWDWRVHGAKVDGFTYGLNTESEKRLIDFAAANKLEYSMIDADWYGPEREKKSNPLKSTEAIDVPYLAKYAKEKNVGLWVYINTKALKGFDLDKTLSTYKQWGIVGIKQGFLGNHEQSGVEFCHKVVKKCAEYGLMYDCHEAIKPSGFERTYPNFMSREYAHSLADGRISKDTAYVAKMVFVNGIAGPLDHTPGMFELNSVLKRDKVWEEIDSTVAAQAARCLVIYTPLLCLADHGEAYAKKADLFEFIKKLPMNWDETKVINGKIGEYITVARRHGDQWFVASLTDLSGRELDIPLDFLGEGKYKATIYGDADKTDNVKNREEYEVKTITVIKTDVIQARLASGGGQCMWIRPVNSNE